MALKHINSSARRTGRDVEFKFNCDVSLAHRPKQIRVWRHRVETAGDRRRLAHTHEDSITAWARGQAAATRRQAAPIARRHAHPSISRRKPRRRWTSAQVRGVENSGREHAAGRFRGGRPRRLRSVTVGRDIKRLATRVASAEETECPGNSGVTCHSYRVPFDF